MRNGIGIWFALFFFSVGRWVTRLLSDWRRKGLEDRFECFVVFLIGGERQCVLSTSEGLNSPMSRFFFLTSRVTDTFSIRFEFRFVWFRRGRESIIV